MLPALIFMLLNGVLPLIAYKHLGPAGCFTALLFTIPISCIALGIICFASIDYFVKKILLSRINSSGSNAKEVLANKDNVYKQLKDKYLEFNFLYVFLCFIAATFFAIAIPNRVVTVEEFVKMFAVPFAAMDVSYFIIELAEKKNIFDAFLSTFIIGTVAMVMGGAVVLIFAIIYVSLQISAAIVGILMAVIAYISIALSGDW